MRPISLGHFKHTRPLNIGDPIFGTIVADYVMDLSQCAVWNVGKEVMFNLNIQPKTHTTCHDIVGAVIDCAYDLVLQEIL